MDRKLLASLVLTGVWFLAAASCNRAPEGASSPQGVADALTRVIEREAYGELLHAPGLFFSPTRNQVDDSRERRSLGGRPA